MNCNFDFWMGFWLGWMVLTLIHMIGTLIVIFYKEYQRKNEQN